MRTVKEIEPEIVRFVIERFGAPDEITAQSELFREGIVDSIGVLLLVQFLEERFGVRVEPDEMVLENFATAQAMAQFVSRH